MTKIQISDIARGVGRPKINAEQIPARFPAGTFARIDGVLGRSETRTDLIREAVEREIARRLAAQAEPQAPQDSD